jgi:hypothetical protein
MTDVVADAYATMADFRTYLRVTAITDATDPDTTIELIALEAAARAIERACNRRFTVKTGSATARYFTARYTPDTYPSNPSYLGGAVQHYVLPIDDTTLSPTAVAFDTTGNGDYDTTTTAYRLGPLSASVRGLPYSLLIFDSGQYPPTFSDGVKVTDDWGWAAIPNTIRSANLLQAARFVKRRDSPFGVAGSPDMGNELRLLSKLDPDVAIMIGAYKNNWGAV